ncbi:hypothetical protein [Serratia inhibens]|uniref:hypothetical protein n=1 Tax=Serratia inhibens TaxID=2338073 RepID=UPI0008096E37|nr:hypothetical protein [Serratia inhibens]ANS41614.1 hypothetical protein Q5A_005660 [Serratia inhibens PRI-2C]
MGLIDYVFSLLILFAIIFLPIFIKQCPPPEKNEELPSSFVDTHQDALQANLNNNRPFQNKNVAWLDEADTIKVAANLHIIYVSEHGIIIKTDVRVSAYHTKSGLIYGHCHYYATESTLYTNKINMAIDIESNEDVTNRLRSFLRKNRV